MEGATKDGLLINTAPVDLEQEDDNAKTITEALCRVEIEPIIESIFPAQNSDASSNDNVEDPKEQVTISSKEDIKASIDDCIERGVFRLILHSPNEACGDDLSPQNILEALSPL